MMHVFVASCILRGVLALPGDDLIADRSKHPHVGSLMKECMTGTCAKPKKKYERISNTQPGYQWDDAGGYCGSWSIQRAAMAKGAWISQAQVRNHTVPGGGHDNEILETNIDLALRNLKLKAEAFDYKNLQTPQLDSGRKWMKMQLSKGHVLVQMIMFPSAHFPVYPGLPYGDYSHIEPIVGIMSDHPLTETNFYDDDYIVHYDDAGEVPLYRSMASLPGKFTWGVAQCPGGGTWPDSEMCLHPKYVFSWAIQGFQDTREGFSSSLIVEPWKREPDTRSGESPMQLKGTVTINGLKVGEHYALYRWDSVTSAFDYSNPTSVRRFVAGNVTEIYEDPRMIVSDGTTYYRCITDSGLVI